MRDLLRGLAGGVLLCSAFLCGLLACALSKPAPPGPPAISSLSLEEKVGQLFGVSGEGVYLSDDSPAFRRLADLVTKDHVGGVMWLRSQVYETAALNRRLQALAAIPLLVSADLETGVGMRFPDLPNGPTAMALAAAGDADLAARRARVTAAQARALGISQVYAPVADVNVDPDNPVINVRSFGEDPADVARFVAATVKGLQAGGVTATLKHFPGHGDTATDSHRALAVLGASRSRLEAVELVPFRAGLAAGVRSVMVGHLSVPALDPEPAPVRENVKRDDVFTAKAGEVERQGTVPATLSAPIVDGLLRRELGFDGLVVTDAMRMGGTVAHYEPGESAVRAILAGCDVVLMPADERASIDAVKAAVRSGRIPAERLDRAVARVLAEKERLGLFTRRSPSLEELPRTLGTREQLAVEEEVARRSLTLLREEPGILPLAASKRLLFVVVADEPSFPGLDGSLANLLRERFASAPAPPTLVRLGPNACDADVEAAVSKAREADVVVVALFVRARSGAGVISVPAPGRAAVSRILTGRVPVVAVSFGSPYLLRDFPSLKTFLCAYSPVPVVQSAALGALLGETAIEGSLPVTIPGIAPRGSGIRKAAGK